MKKILFCTLVFFNLLFGLSKVYGQNAIIEKDSVVAFLLSDKTFDLMPNRDILLSSTQSPFVFGKTGNGYTFLPVHFSEVQSFVKIKSPTQILQNGKFLDIRICLFLTSDKGAVCLPWLYSLYLYFIRCIRI